LALPEATADMLRYARTVACRAVAQSLETPAGVVHLNFPFREPLVPSPAEAWSEWKTKRSTDGGRTAVRAGDVQPALARPEMLARLAMDLSFVQRGLILAGPQSDRSFPAAVAGLSAELGYPILADPLSQARCGPHDRQAVIDAYAAFLRGAGLVERLAPEVILRFGMPPTSKPLQLYLQRYSHVRQILVDEEAAWNDPTRSASERFMPTQRCSARR